MMTKNGRGALRLYRSYNFTLKDPIIDRVRTLIKDEGVDNGQVALLSGVASTTLHGWFLGQTRRPQYATVAAVVQSLGYEATFTKAKQINIKRELEKAAAEILKHQRNAKRRSKNGK